MFKSFLVQIVLISLNAFFAAAEIALLSANENKVRSLAEDGEKKAVKMLKIIEEPTRFLSTIQIGITLAGFLGSAFAAESFAELLTEFLLNSFGISGRYFGVINTVSVILITVILSYFTLILGELVPKRVAMKHKEKLGFAVCGIISFLAAALKPIIWFLTKSTNVILRIIGIDPNEKDDAVSEEDIVLMLDAGADDGTIKEDDIELIKNVFKLDNMTAEDVMTPRKNVVFLEDTASKEEILSTIEEEGYSRIPVYKEDVDHIIGILHARDFLLKYQNKDFDISNCLHEPNFVPETINLDILFKDMQKDHNHMVMVVNEYGETSGIVTMEDILEEIVGEIWDESDEEVKEFLEIKDSVYRVLCTASVEDFFEFFSLEKPEEEIDSATVNGWLMEMSGNIPKEGHTVDYQNISITVTKADDFMAHEVIVEVKKKPEEN